MRNLAPTSEHQDGTERPVTLTDIPAPERLQIEKTSCYAIKDDDTSSIKVFNPEGNELFGLSQRAVSFESKPLFLFLQVYVLGVNNGKAAAQQELKKKISDLVNLLL